MGIVYSLIMLYLFNLHLYSVESTNFYWRDYNSYNIPTDAVPGGVDKNGDSTYIAQFPGKHLEFADPADVILATVYKLSPQAYGVYGSQVVETSYNVKILCGNRGNRWSTTMENNCNLAQGGSINSSTIYIGRANYRGQNVIGSFTKDEYILSVPWITLADKNVINVNSFEMLIEC